METKIRKDKWKMRFVLLCSANIILIACLLIWLYAPIPKTEMEDAGNQYKTKDSSEFIVKTTKKNINNLANAYIDELLEGANHKYAINLDEEVELYGELPFFSSTIPLYINFNPVVQKNGDLVLKQESISVGQLQLPNKKIMQYVKKYLPVPNWVIIQPDKQSVYVKVTEMDIKSNFKIGVEQFDLDKDIISLRLKVPYETLGIDVAKHLD